MQTSGEEKEKEEKRRGESISGFGDWALIFGVTTTVLVAAGAAAYVIKKKRDNELATLRYGGKVRSVNNSDMNWFEYAISTFSSVWEKAPSLFNQINSKVTTFLKSMKTQNTNPLNTEDVRLDMSDTE